jgi:hypothetical protein
VEDTHPARLYFSRDAAAMARALDKAFTGNQKAFANTPPPLVQDFVKQLGDAEKNDTALFKANLATHGADALTRF